MPRKKPVAKETTEEVTLPTELSMEVDPQPAWEGGLTGILTKTVLWQPTMALMFNNYNELQQLWTDAHDLSGKTMEWRRVPTTYQDAQKIYGIKLP